MTGMIGPEDLPLSPLLEAESGGLLMVEFQGLHGRFQSTLAGLTPDGCLMVRIPRAVTTRHPLREGDTVVIRYVHDGTVYGFRAEVLNYTFRPHPVMVLSQPTGIGMLRLRQDERVPCLIPATATTSSRTLNGMILDLSRNGCRFAYEPSPGEPTAVTPDEKIELLFPLFEIDARQSVSGRVRSLSDQDGTLRVGVEFEVLEAAVRASIEAYIASVIDFLDEQAA